MRGPSVVFSGQVRALDLLPGSTVSRIVTGGALQLGTLAPDEYTFEVTVTDRLRKKEKGSVVRQALDFTVE